MAITVEPLGSKGTYAADTAISSAYPATWNVGDTAIVCFSGDAQATGALVVDAGASAADLTLTKVAEASNAGNVAVSIWSGTVLTAAGEEFALAGETAGYGGTIVALWADDTHIYCAGSTTETIRKYLKIDMSYIGETAGYGGTIIALWGDDTHIYCGGDTTETIRKYLKSDLSYIGETAGYGGTIYGLWGDDTHVYCGGDTTQTIRKYLKSDRSYIGETAGYGDTILCLWGDDTHVYCGGQVTDRVRQYLKSNLGLIGQTLDYGGTIWALWGDDTHIYCGGAVTNTIRKYLKSNRSYIGETAGYGGTIYGLWGDDTHVYCGGHTTETIRKYLKSDRSYIGETAGYGGTIQALWGDGGYVGCGGSTTETIRKYIKIGNGSAAGSGVITVSYSSMTAKAIAYYRATGLAASPFDKSATATGSGDAPSSGATDTLTQADELGIGVIGMEEGLDEAGTWTTGAGYVSGNALIACADGGGAKSSTVMAVAEVLSATTAQTAAQTGTLGNDWAAAVATYLMAEAVAGFIHSFGMIIT